LKPWTTGGEGVLVFFDVGDLDLRGECLGESRGLSLRGVDRIEASSFESSGTVTFELGEEEPIRKADIVNGEVDGQILKKNLLSAIELFEE
jgi:hypothetical protein